MSNRGRYISAVSGATNIPLLSGETLLIGRLHVFGSEFCEMIEQDKPGLTERIILNIQTYASHGVGRLYEILAEIDGWGNGPLSQRGIKERVARLVSRGTLLALILPAVALSALARDNTQLEDMSADLGQQEGVDAKQIARAEKATSMRDLSDMKLKLAYVLKNSVTHILDTKIATTLKNAMTTTAIVSIAVVLAAWAASHFTGVGFAVDAILVAIGWAILGWSIFSAVTKLWKWVKHIYHATTLQELDDASKMFAKIVTDFGAELLIGLLTRGAGRMRAKSSSKPDGSGSGSAGGAGGKSKADIEADNKAKAAAAKKDEAAKKTADDEAAANRNANLISSRKTTARDFYKKQGWNDAKIDDHMGGIDFNQPVEVISLKKGTVMGQWQSPGAPKGNYFAPIDETPGSIGVSSVGHNRATDMAESKTQALYKLSEDMDVLSSKAASIVDDWSFPNVSAVTPGGGQQYFVPDISKFAPYP